MNPSIQAVIFDFNGTLFYDTDFHNQAWMEFAKAYGKKLGIAEMERHVHGFTNKEILEYLFQHEISGEELFSLGEEKEKKYRSICMQHPTKCVFTPGAVEFLNHLHQYKIPRTIATASTWENVEFFISLFSLEEWFEVDKIIYDNGNYRGKPHPDLFLAAAEKLKMPIANCLIIEDSIGGVKAAKNAGAGKIIAYSLDSTSEKFSQLNFIDQLITDFRQIKL